MRGPVWKQIGRIGLTMRCAALRHRTALGIKRTWDEPLEFLRVENSDASVRHLDNPSTGKICRGPADRLQGHPQMVGNIRTGHRKGNIKFVAGDPSPPVAHMEEKPAYLLHRRALAYHRHCFAGRFEFRAGPAMKLAEHTIISPHELVVGFEAQPANGKVRNSACALAARLVRKYADEVARDRKAKHVTRSVRQHPGQARDPVRDDVDEARSLPLTVDRAPRRYAEFLRKRAPFFEVGERDDATGRQRTHWTLEAFRLGVHLRPDWMAMV